jgi:hypothetical protein
MSGAASTPEPAPKPNDLVAIWPLVCEDLRGEFGDIEAMCTEAMQRDAFGRAKYGTPLQPFNNRDALTDAYQELLDGAVYLKQALLEGLPIQQEYDHTLALAVRLHRRIAHRDALCRGLVKP